MGLCASHTDDIADLRKSYIQNLEAHHQRVQNEEQNKRAVAAQRLASTRTSSTRPGPALVVPYLFLGDELTAADWAWCQANGVTAIVNVSSECPNFHEDAAAAVEYINIPVEDNGTQYWALPCTLVFSLCVCLLLPFASFAAGRANTLCSCF